MNTPEQIVDILLEEQTPVTVEYRPVTIDSMPHVIWLIRADTSSDSNYLARGTAHNLERAEKEVAKKVQLFGAIITKIEKSGV